MAPSAPITLTFGGGDTDRIWADVRSVSWSEVCALLTDHHEGNKRGPCIVPARFRGQRRVQAEADEIGMVMLDADCGHDLDEIERAIRAKGWAAIIHSTHSHLTTRTRASRARWEAFFADCPIAAEEYFLREKGYLAPVAQGARVVETGKREVVFEHAPCPKFRIALPLSRPWRAAEYPDQKIANAAWKDRIKTLAVALGLHYDQSCTDTSRLFYLPRHAAGAPFATRVIDGETCDIWSLPAVVASTAATVPPPSPLRIGSTPCVDVADTHGNETIDSLAGPRAMGIASGSSTL